MRKLLVIAAALVLVGAGSLAWAQSSTLSGKVISSTTGSLVIEDQNGERHTFVITDQTMLPGPLQSGSYVSVEYNTAADQSRQATRVSASESESELPETASPLSLLALIGMASLGGGAALRYLRRS